MVGHDRLALAGRGQVQLAQTVEMAAAHAHEIPQPGVAGGPGEAGVELTVELDEGGKVAAPQGVALLVQQAPRRRNLHLVAVQGQGAGDFQFDGGAQELGFLGIGDVDAGDQGLGLRIDIDQSFLLQLQDGVADRRLADPVKLGEGRARQAGAGLQVQRQDAIAQVVVDLLRRQPFAVDRKGRNVHGLKEGIGGGAFGHRKFLISILLA